MLRGDPEAEREVLKMDKGVMDTTGCYAVYPPEAEQ